MIYEAIPFITLIVTLFLLFRYNLTKNQLTLFFVYALSIINLAVSVIFSIIYYEFIEIYIIVAAIMIGVFITTYCKMDKAMTQ